MFFNTDDSGNNTGNNISNDEVDFSIPKEYWGTWIRMDTGDDVYSMSEFDRKNCKVRTGEEEFVKAFVAAMN